MNNFFNKFGLFFGNALNNASSAASAAWDEAKKGFDAATKVQFSDKEVWMQVVVQKAELKGSVIFVTGKDAKTSKSMVMTLNLSGQYRDSQTKKLGILLAFMGQCPKETVEEACTAINEAPEKRVLVLLKAWSSDQTLANVVRVQAHDHVAKAKGDEPKAEAKPKIEAKKAKKSKAKAKAELDESC
jgi:hypothetical protein